MGTTTKLQQVHVYRLMKMLSFFYIDKKKHTVKLKTSSFVDNLINKKSFKS